MKNRLLFLLKYNIFWIVLSVVAKVIFLFYQYKEAAELEISDYARIFLYGLRLDLSLGGYIMMLSCVIMICSFFWNERIIRRIFSGTTLFLLIFFTGTVAVDLELFKNWGFHLDATPLYYLKTPKEAMASTPVWLIVCLFLLWIALIVSGWYIFRKFVINTLHYEQRKLWFAPVFLLLGGLMIIPVRGGFNVAPMNSSFVFFHPKNMFANQAAINPVWNFIYELMHINKFQNNYVFMPQERATQIVDSLMNTDTIFPWLLNNDKPNIVFLLLEGFTANAIGALGGVQGVTPNLDSLVKDGVLFSNIYATASRSDRGMVAAISAFPSHPDIAMIRYPEKTIAYARFPKDMEAIGYSTRYYYAGDINFGGFRSYVTMSFQDMVTEEDFSGEAKANRFKWGIHDQYMFERLYEDIIQAPQPFMYTAFNMSSHEPFEVPMVTKIPGDDIAHRFMNAISYSDSCVGDFIRKCKSSSIWDNTLFILMADHGTRHIGGFDVVSPEAYRIPLILAGGVLNVRDTVIATIGSQTDMVATVLAQLGIDHSAYRYSRNLLANGLIPFAFYSYSNAAGVVSEHGVSIYDLKSNTYIQEDSLKRNNELLEAFLQSVNNDINSR